MSLYRGHICHTALSALKVPDWKTQDMKSTERVVFLGTIVSCRLIVVQQDLSQ